MAAKVRAIYPHPDEEAFLAKVNTTLRALMAEGGELLKSPSGGNAEIAIDRAIEGLEGALVTASIEPEEDDGSDEAYDTMRDERDAARAL